MDGWLSNLPRIYAIHQERLELAQPFEKIAGCFAEDPGTVFLLSGSNQDCARYHILAARPWLEMTSRRDRVILRCRPLWDSPKRTLLPMPRYSAENWDSSEDEVQPPKGLTPNEQAKTLTHLLTRTAKCAECEWCQRTKLQHKQCRRTGE